MELKPLVTEKADARSAEVTIGGRMHGRGVAMDFANWRETRQTEQPWHTHAAKYLSLGLPNSEVAALCDVTPNSITSLLKNAWFQELVKEFLCENNRDIMALVDAEAINSLQVLVSLRDDDKVSPTVRSANAKAILEWKLGKPTQRVELAPTTTSNDPVAEFQQLEVANANLRQSL